MRQPIIDPARRWRPSGSLARALVVAVAGIAGAVVRGEPALLVLVAPVATAGVIALARRPVGVPEVSARLDHLSLPEGQLVTSRLRLTGVTDDCESVTRVFPRGRLVRVRPASGLTVLRRGTDGGEGDGGSEDRAHDVAIGPRRWGIQALGEERVGLTSRWAGYRWGPAQLDGTRVRVLPVAPAYTSTAEAPQPDGLVGAHRSARPGSGTELAGIRPYASGDRLRRINWRVSARTGELHVTTTRAEQDAGLLIVADVLAEHGTSGGLGGEVSSLDLTVRAAAALAERAVRTGDRVSLRPVGGRGRTVPPGAGQRHLHRLLGALAELQPGTYSDNLADPSEGTRLDLRVGAGSTVVVLSPLLVASVSTAVVSLQRRGVPVVVIDTLPAGTRPAADPGIDPALVDLAWRMRRVERDLVERALLSIGCPVVPWTGAGTVDEVLRQLARRAEQPRVRA